MNFQNFQTPNIRCLDKANREVQTFLDIAMQTGTSVQTVANEYEKNGHVRPGTFGLKSMPEVTVALTHEGKQRKWKRRFGDTLMCTESIDGGTNENITIDVGCVEEFERILNNKRNKRTSKL
jgi:hypothetical protein